MSFCIHHNTVRECVWVCLHFCLCVCTIEHFRVFIMCICLMAFALHYKLVLVGEFLAIQHRCFINKLATKLQLLRQLFIDIKIGPKGHNVKPQQNTNEGWSTYKEKNI